MTIFGLEPSEPMHDGWTPLEATAVVKCLDEDGNLVFAIRSTETLTDWEAFAMLELAARAQARDVLEGFEPG